MGVPAVVEPGVPTLRIRGTAYPVLLPRIGDPRLHLAAVIVSLQVLGQVAFDFTLSIAQILVALGTSAVLEVAIAFRSRGVILWPASALLTGNGVAFVLRVPGTEHGDWWSLHGWWIFAGTAAFALLSKHLITFRGRHVFNPSNIGLVVCFLLLGPERADPLALWWGPMSAWMALALAIIVLGGLAILLRLGLLGIAVSFWLAFAAGIAVLAASGHEMTARWHLGPITGLEFWRVLVFSPEILVFLFFMITDPKTIPDGARARRAYAVAVALLAVLLIAPWTTEFATKVAVLGSLALVSLARPVLLLLAETRARGAAARLAGAGRGRLALGARTLAAVAAFTGLLVLVGIPARPGVAVASAPVSSAEPLPEVTVVASEEVATELDAATAQRIARDLVADLRIESDALRLRDTERATGGATGARLQALWAEIRAATGLELVVPVHRVDRLRVTLEAGDGQGPPRVIATAAGTVELVTYAGSPPEPTDRTEPTAFERTLELSADGAGRYLITDVRGAGGLVRVAAPASSAGAAATGLADVRLRDVARRVGLDFRHGAFRFGVNTEPAAMMGGGVCWLDYDGDGWLDLYAVNTHSELEFARWEQRGGLPRNGLFRNVEGRFTDVGRGSGADLALRGSGCVAADFDLDGRTDLYVTATGYDALLWNDGDGTFTEGARTAGITDYGWHAGAAVGDVNGDGLPDLFVAGYTDVNGMIPGSTAGFPTDHVAVRDRLYLNQGRRGPGGRPTFREVSRPAGIEASRVDHGLGAVLADVTGDGRLDLYVANDADPNRLYVNVPYAGGAAADPKGLGFRLVDRAPRMGVDDPNAGMGIAAADYDLDGRTDLVVTNSHRQLHAVYRSRPGQGAPSFADARPAFAPSLDTSLAGWGVSWADLDLDGDLDLAVANGAVPVTSLRRDAEPVQVIGNLTAQGRVGEVASATGLVLPRPGVSRIGRGLAAADYDNDGDLDLAVGTIGGPLALLETSGADGHWLEVALPVFAPGAVVTAVLPDGRTLTRELRAGSSYLSSEDPRAHFGLGDATEVSELRVRYPGGREVRLTDVAVDRVVTVPEPR